MLSKGHFLLLMSDLCLLCQIVIEVLFIGRWGYLEEDMTIQFDTVDNFWKNIIF